MTSSLPTGLRERKKAKTRAAIREHAMRLFDEQGYAATTVDQIAEAADVSQSTFFRYFPTKEDVVLSDDYDPILVAALRAQPADLPPVEAIRRSIRGLFSQFTEEQWEQERRRQQLIQTVPELRMRTQQQYADSIVLLAEVVAERAGLPADDFSARVLAGAVIGAALAATRDGLNMAQGVSYFEDFDRALALLQAGLPLGPPAI
ncbi:TetR family transcriptional regulator [Actinoplanes sp. ATCC 53533]|uniref:acyl-CoA-like ligand-binding transcription factor n=1 Tax=Actinoplanes sp. ATCC 53533 TaxID=1288362 RepID=UPI000F7BA5D1|nr:TetR family transcriptional regulator [Actinoplanes sp. ATCC 53533]RSM72565.1 TetR family transcriptional regulator [Actinoplanes sp. ATCC 53533]